MEVQLNNTNTENVRATNETASIQTKREEKPQESNASQEAPLTRQEVEGLTEKIQESLDSMNINLKFATYGKNNERTAITVTEKETGKEVREIPSEEIQQLYLKMNELTGILFNRTV